eukprot:GILK01005068.1.p1 GENE.GILK01005068.1~~GILK01005068.1.p1  ORF type:complete len:366 (-),score=27.65 GILK01005068.1:51-1148(-)
MAQRVCQHFRRGACRYGSHCRDLHETLETSKPAVENVPGRSESFGVVPWLKVNGKLYCITQLSYSSSLFDVKLDPFRGKAEDTETPFAAACRELYEESANLFLIDGLLDSDNHVDRLYHVAFQFVQEDLMRLVDDYDSNRHHDPECETDGIAIVMRDEMTTPTCSPRISSQLTSMLRQAVPAFPIPLFQMQQSIQADQRVLYTGTRQVEGVPNLEAMPNVTMDDPSNLWQYSEMARDVRARDRVNALILRRRNAQLRDYPKDEVDMVTKCLKGVVDPLAEHLTSKNVATAISNLQHHVRTSGTFNDAPVNALAARFSNDVRVSGTTQAQNPGPVSWRRTEQAHTTQRGATVTQHDSGSQKKNVRQ